MCKGEFINNIISSDWSLSVHTHTQTYISACNFFRLHFLHNFQNIFGYTSYSV
uniref:Uncharacterized protein n=1 Tax=Octopus bimaculoides TaxID=37653 RepID=A0A0L8FUH2_OCTBM